MQGSVTSWRVVTPPRHVFARGRQIVCSAPADSAEETPEPLDTQRLRNCLAALPERERAVLVMTFYDDRPADAVAAEHKLSAGNVRVIRHRGLERLRGCMQSSGGNA